MPKLDSDLHVKMLERQSHGRLYGMQWGNPETDPALIRVRDHWLGEHLKPGLTVLEIGPGGGRWTRYMLDCKKIYAVDYHQELLDECKKNFNQPNIVYIKNNGNDFPGVAPGSIDFLFSYGVFVHLDLDIVQAYLENMKPLLKPETNVVIHYPDKTKPAAQANKTFADNSPDKMRALVTKAGYRIHEEDTESLKHSALIRFSL